MLAQSTGLLCDPGQPQADGSTLFCCTSGSCFAQPAADNACPGGTTYLCGSSEVPQGSGSTLSCASLGSPEGGPGFTRYCCKDVSCATDPSVTGCIPGTAGYSCMHPATPDLAQAGLVCPQNGAGGSGTTYCCNTLGDACEPDLTVPCGAGTFGYSCKGLFTPGYGGGWSLPCTEGTATASKTEYCCGLPATCATYTSDLCGSSTTVTGWLCSGTNVPGTGTCGPAAALGSQLTGYCCN
jgi:hypothetical protein